MIIIYIFSSYCAVNTFRMHYKSNQLMLYRKIIAVCSENHTERKSIRCGQNTEILNAKPDGTRSNNYDVRGYRH